jgi:hypothetical protein
MLEFYRQLAHCGSSCFLWFCRLFWVLTISSNKPPNPRSEAVFYWRVGFIGWEKIRAAQTAPTSTRLRNFNVPVS